MDNSMNKWMIWGAHPYFWKHPNVSYIVGAQGVSTIQPAEFVDVFDKGTWDCRSTVLWNGSCGYHWDLLELREKWHGLDLTWPPQDAIVANKDFWGFPMIPHSKCLNMQKILVVTCWVEGICKTWCYYSSNFCLTGKDCRLEDVMWQYILTLCSSS